MNGECVTGSKADIRKFASWYKAELLKSLGGKDEDRISAREKFGLESLESGGYRIGSDNLAAAAEALLSQKMPVVRRLAGIPQKSLDGCLEEFASKTDDEEAVERLRAAVAWLSDVRDLKLC